MEPGIFETVFPRPTLAASLDAVAAHDLRWVQFDLASAGLTSLPAAIADPLAKHIRQETSARGIRLAAVSGTYNMVHPDPRVRDQGLASLQAIAAAGAEMGVSVITLSTGTRDPDHMWRWHPENSSPEAWRDLLEALTAALAIAEDENVVLAIEPEPANIAANAVLARDLLRELGHPRLKIVLDPANIVASDLARPPAAVLDEAFTLLGEHIVVAHAKDLDDRGHFCAAGRGIVPWDHCLALFRDVAYAGPLILHSLAENDANRAVTFLRQRIAQVSTR